MDFDLDTSEYGDYADRDGADDEWVQFHNRRRRMRMRFVAALLVSLLVLPIVITFFRQILR